MCNECNSSYKLTKDPLKDSSNKRRKAFYSYMAADSEIKITLEITNRNIGTLTPADINLQINSRNHNEEVQTWKELFGIEERYKAKYTGNTAKYWYMQVIDEAQNYGNTTHNVLNIKKKQAERYPWEETNFLRLPFLEACERAGLFKVVEISTR